MQTYFMEYLEELDCDRMDAYGMFRHTDSQRDRISHLLVALNSIVDMEGGDTELSPAFGFFNQYVAELNPNHQHHQFASADGAVLESLLVEKLNQLAPIGWHFTQFSATRKAHGGRWWGFVHGIKQDGYFRFCTHNYRTKGIDLYCN